MSGALALRIFSQAIFNWRVVFGTWAVKEW
jgi:hypothetical protein